MVTVDPLAEIAVMCRRPGCRTKYKPSENFDGACRYHAKPPIFHDCDKKWPCCGKRSDDWDEFMKIPGCKTGCHSNEKVVIKKIEQDPATVPKKVEDSAPKPISTNTGYTERTPVPYKEEAPEPPKVEVKMKPKITKSGKYICMHGGCNKEFEPDENPEGCCNYHVGKPIFHDCYKYWSCCPHIKKMDWDEFKEIPPCTVGCHEPKMVKAE